MTFPQLSIARLSFIQLSEPGHRGENDLAFVRIPLDRVHVMYLNSVHYNFTCLVFDDK